MYKILTIKEFSDFKCTGKDCPDNCCHSWRITIDKQTYKKYKNTKNFNMSNIIRLDKPMGRHVACMKLTDSKKCSFLNEHNLCSIHANLGADYLCKVCKHFPRLNNILGDTIEQYIDISCPSAANILFENKEPLEFNIDVTKKKIYSTFNFLNKDYLLDSDLSFRLRALCISIIQNRDLSLIDRLSILNKLCLLIDTLIADKSSSEDIEQYLDRLEFDYLDYIKPESSIDSILNNEQKVTMMIDLGKTSLSFLNMVSRNSNENFNIRYKNLKRTINTISSDDLTKFKNSAILDYFKNNEHVLENYLVYHMFSSVFPLTSKSCSDAFQKMLIKLVVLNIFLVGLYYDKTSLTNEDVRNALYMQEKGLFHTSYSSNALEELFKKINIKSDYLLSLIF